MDKRRDDDYELENFVNDGITMGIEYDYDDEDEYEDDDD